MGDKVQYRLLEKLRPELKGSVLEVGAKFWGSDVSFNYRKLFPNETFVGTDMSPGENVDVVCDLTADFATVDRAFGGKRFSTIICYSVFEHCAQPFRMAENIERLLEAGGVLVIGVPFVFPIHGYPNDYWRFTPNGIRNLFPSLDFSKREGLFHANDDLEEEIQPVSKLPDYWLDLRTAKYRREKRYLLFLGAALLKFLGAIGIFSWLTKFRFVFPVINLTMYGYKAGTAEKEGR